MSDFEVFMQEQRKIAEEAWAARQGLLGTYRAVDFPIPHQPH